MNPAISNAERKQQIVSMLEQEKRITVEAVCARYLVSEATARRDLDALARKDKLKRVHGGALPLHQSPPEQPILSHPKFAVIDAHNHLAHPFGGGCGDDPDGSLGCCAGLQHLGFQI